jgi:acetyltransferase-like isoleucine patch superfamily enzyme
MAYYNNSELATLGFKKVGSNVLVSKSAAIYNHHQIEIGDNTRIDDFCVISGRVVLGRNIHIAVFCNVAGGEPGVFMHDFSGLAYGCQVFAQSDDYSGRTLTNPTVPDKFKRETKAKVVIGRHCILGTAVVVYPGVEIAEGTAVGSMSVVNRSTESWSIYMGIPARKVKNRSKQLLELEQLYLQEEQDNQDKPK